MQLQVTPRFRCSVIFLVARGIAVKRGGECEPVRQLTRDEPVVRDAVPVGPWQRADPARVFVASLDQHSIGVRRIPTGLEDPRIAEESPQASPDLVQVLVRVEGGHAVDGQERDHHDDLPVADAQAPHARPKGVQQGPLRPCARTTTPAPPRIGRRRLLHRVRFTCGDREQRRRRLVTSRAPLGVEDVHGKAGAQERFDLLRRRTQQLHGWRVSEPPRPEPQGASKVRVEDAAPTLRAKHMGGVQRGEGLPDVGDRLAGREALALVPVDRASIDVEPEAKWATTHVHDRRLRPQERAQGRPSQQEQVLVAARNGEHAGATRLGGEQVGLRRIAWIPVRPLALRTVVLLDLENVEIQLVLRRSATRDVVQAQHLACNPKLIERPHQLVSSPTDHRATFAFFFTPGCFPNAQRARASVDLRRYRRPLH